MSKDKQKSVKEYILELRMENLELKNELRRVYGLAHSLKAKVDYMEFMDTLKRVEE